MTATDDTRFWNRFSEKYAERPLTDPAGYERSLERTRAYLSPDDRVLELGCGTGTTAFHLAGLVAAYLATDFATDMIAIARNKQAGQTLPGLRFETATAESLPDTPRFNAVLGFNYLHLVRDLPGTLRRIHTLMEPGGLFISKTPCLGDMTVLIQLAIPLMRLFGKAPYAGSFGQAELIRQLEQTGFDIEAVEDHTMKGKAIRPFIVARKT